MPNMAKHWGTLGQHADSKRFASLRVAQAASEVESALAALSSALRDDAQLRATEALGTVKRVLSDGGVRVQGLLTRVPAVGPWLVMELHRSKRENATGEELFLQPSNYEEGAFASETTMVAYLECIGCHMA